MKRIIISLISMILVISFSFASEYSVSHKQYIYESSLCSIKSYNAGEVYCPFSEENRYINKYNDSWLGDNFNAFYVAPWGNIDQNLLYHKKIFLGWEIKISRNMEEK